MFDVCKSICVVEKGALKAYVLDETGQERITAFALEEWTKGDLYSFIKEEPATYCRYFLTSSLFLALA